MSRRGHGEGNRPCVQESRSPQGARLRVWRRSAPISVPAPCALLFVTVLAALVGVLAAPPARAQDSLASYALDVGGRAVRIPSIRVRGGLGKPHLELVSLRGAAAVLGGSVAPGERAGAFEWDLADSRIRFTPESPGLVRVDGQVVPLSQGARRIGSDLYLPPDFLKHVVLPILSAAGKGAAWGGRLGAAADGGADGSGRAGEGSGRADSAAASAIQTAAQPALQLARAEVSAPSPGSPGASPGPSPGASPGHVGREGASGGAPFTIVLDPGHGGSETGAAGKSGTLEKEITLDIARRLKAALAGEPGLAVLLTRDGDDLVELDDRTALANQNHAALFLSIHVNSARRSDARGAETYLLSQKAKDEDIRTLAAIENNAAGVDRERMGAVPEGLELILWDLAQSQYLQESSHVAEMIQKELNEALGIKDRGVKQAPFRVLMGATMPAILVEVGFISNPAEETQLNASEHRDRVAGAIARAVVTFLSEERRRLRGTPTPQRQH